MGMDKTIFVVDIENMRLFSDDHPCLKQESDPLHESYFGSETLKNFVSRMFEIMYENKGAGLSAPQVGTNLRLFIMGDQTSQFVCINPEIVDHSDNEISWKEGCLSYKNLYLDIKRPERILAKWYDLSGKEHVKQLDGLWSRCFQHELDHLNGIVFKDHVSKLKLQMAERKRRKQTKEKK